MIDTIATILARQIQRSGSLFQPVLVTNETSAWMIMGELSEIGVTFAQGIGKDVAIPLALGSLARQGLLEQQAIMVFVTEPLSEVCLNAVNLGRDDIAGCGKPFIWLMGLDQMRQLQGCPDLWSCRSTELHDESMTRNPPQEGEDEIGRKVRLGLLYHRDPKIHAKIKRYSFLSGYVARTDAEEAEVHELYQYLHQIGEDPGWPLTKRVPLDEHLSYGLRRKS